MSVLASWLARQGEQALRRRDLRPEQRRALHAIQRCRTPVSGGQRYRCAHCGGEHLGFHSCHHRACPRCGGARTAAARLKVPFLGEIPLLPAIRRQADSGLPFVAFDAAHPAADVFMNIAARIWMTLPDKKAAV